MTIPCPDPRRKASAGARAAPGVFCETPAGHSRPPAEPRSHDDPTPLSFARRHNVVREKSDPGSPLQVGNGNFAFGADITGLQTFVPFNTMSQWGWFEFPLPPGTQESDYQSQPWDAHGREVLYWTE